MGQWAEKVTDDETAAEMWPRNLTRDFSARDFSAEILKKNKKNKATTTTVLDRYPFPPRAHVVRHCRIVLVAARVASPPPLTIAIRVAVRPSQRRQQQPPPLARGS